MLRLLLLGILIPTIVTAQDGGPYTANELKYLPVLATALNEHWPTVLVRAYFAAQIRKETCYSLTHPKCWSPTAELKTSREYGFGLGQITITPRFDNFSEAKKLHNSLENWEWKNRYNAEYQLRTLVLMNKFNYNKIGWAHNEVERFAFSFAAYNGGLGGVLSDRQLCRAVESCDSSKWFGNVEFHSNKAKTALGGYSKSFFQINREYVQDVVLFYPPRYRIYFKE
jgi:hypothetical protein